MNTIGKKLHLNFSKKPLMILKQIPKNLISLPSNLIQVINWEIVITQAPHSIEDFETLADSYGRQ